MGEYCLDNYKFSDLRYFDAGEWEGLNRELVRKASSYGGGEVQKMDAEDIVGDIQLGLVKLLHHARRVPQREGRALKPYLFAAVKNRVRRFVKSAYRFNVTPDQELEVILRHRKEKRCDLTWVQEQIEMLPEIQRLAVQLSEQGHGTTTALAGGDQRARGRLYQQKSRAMVKVTALLRAARAADMEFEAF